MLTGCWDSVSIEDRDFVIGISIDKADEGYSTAFAMPILSTDSEDNQNGNEIKSAVGKNISEAFENVNRITAGSLYFGQTKVCIIGREVLSDENGLRSLIDVFEKNNELSRKIIFMVADNAEDILTFGAEDESTSDFIEDYYKNEVYSTGAVINQNFSGMVQDLLSTGNTVLPIICIKDEHIEIRGSVVIKNYKYVCDLNEEQTRGQLWLTNQALGGIIALGQNAVDIKDKKVECRLVNGSVVIDINIKGEITELVDKDMDINAELEKLALADINSCLNEIKVKYKTDVIGLSESLRKNYNYTLGDKFGTIDINVTVKADIKNKENIK